MKLLFAFREDYLGKVKQLLARVPGAHRPGAAARTARADALPTIIRGPFERYPEPLRARALTRRSPSGCATALGERFGTGEVSLSEVQIVCLRLWQSTNPEALLEAKGVQGLLEDYLGEALDRSRPELRAAASRCSARWSPRRARATSSRQTI